MQAEEAATFQMDQGKCLSWVIEGQPWEGASLRGEKVTEVKERRLIVQRNWV